MAHFAELDENNVVLRVIVVHNNELIDKNGVESEAKGIAFCQSLFGANTRWVQTSYNGNFRKRYAGIGSFYDAKNDAFINPKPSPYPSFVLDPITFDWVPPIPRPTDTVYAWSESTLSWKAFPSPYPSWIALGNPLMWTPPVSFPGPGYKWDEPSLSWIKVEGVSE